MFVGAHAIKARDCYIPDWTLCHLGFLPGAPVERSNNWQAPYKFSKSWPLCLIVCHSRQKPRTKTLQSRSLCGLMGYGLMGYKQSSVNYLNFRGSITAAGITCCVLIQQKRIKGLEQKEKAKETAGKWERNWSVLIKKITHLCAPTMLKSVFVLAAFA